MLRELNNNQTKFEGNTVMRKLLFISAAAAALFTATGAGADTFVHKVDLSADADLSCSFSGVPAHTGAMSNVQEGTSELTVAVTPNGVVDQSASLTFANIVCNGTRTNVKIEREGLRLNPLVTATGFNNYIDYTVAVNWGPGAPIVALGVGDVERDKDVGPTSADLVLNIHVPPSSSQLIAGHYIDTLKLTVAPTT